MTTNPIDLLPPRVLVVDDERQIHASLRLRLGRDYDLTCCLDAREALAKLEAERFDLCLADIHMPKMDGLTFIATAQQRDPALGYVILSAFDSDENLRRSIPLQVYDFIPKPLPERDGFEERLPEWIDRTRRRRREQELAQRSDAIAHDLESARLERDVEIVASETARDALLQTANLLTTIQAHLVSAVSVLGARAKTDPGLAHLLRSVEEGRKTADAAMVVSEGFFDSAYGSRDTSLALIDSGLRHAAGIVHRMCATVATNVEIDLSPIDDRLPLRGLSGIDFLLTLVPALAAAVTLATPNTTVRVAGCPLSRLDAATKEPALKHYLWMNRRNAPGGQRAALVTVASTCPAFSRTQAESWLRGEFAPLHTVTARGLVRGVQKSRGLLGISVSPHAAQFSLALVLPA